MLSTSNSMSCRLPSHAVEWGKLLKVCGFLWVVSLHLSGSDSLVSCFFYSFSRSLNPSIDIRISVISGFHKQLRNCRRFAPISNSLTLVFREDSSSASISAACRTNTTPTKAQSIHFRTTKGKQTSTSPKFRAVVHTIQSAFSLSAITARSKVSLLKLSVDSLTLHRARLAHDRPALLDSLHGITSTKLKCCFKCILSWIDASPTWNQINLKRALLPFSLPLYITPSPIGQHCCHSHTFSSLHFGVQSSQVSQWFPQIQYMSDARFFVSHFLLCPTSVSWKLKAQKSMTSSERHACHVVAL